MLAVAGVTLKKNITNVEGGGSGTGDGILTIGAKASDVGATVVGRRYLRSQASAAWRAYHQRASRAQEHGAGGVVRRCMRRRR